jgi:hypothetical protein
LFFPEEHEVLPNEIDDGHGVTSYDNVTWKNNKKEWAGAMWADIGNSRI